MLLGLPFVFLGMGPMFPKLFLGTLERFLGMPIPQLGGQIEQRTFPAGDWPLGDRPCNDKEGPLRVNPPGTIADFSG